MPIYLDNAATSWPKSPVVLSAMHRSLEQGFGNPGRGGHAFSLHAAREVYEARVSLSRMLGAPSSDRVIFTKNATEAVNFVLFGYLRPGDHVITSSMEHNAVMRPLRRLESVGTELSFIPSGSDGLFDPAEVKKLLRPNTRLIFLNHASNVCGTISPIHEVGKIAAESGVSFAIDATQTAGVVPVDMRKHHIDYLIFTGHKALGGLQGVGGLILGNEADLNPILFGGTGSASESEKQPDFLPDKLESGTLNALGIAGLGAALRELEAIGIETVQKHEQMLLRQLLDGLTLLPQVKIHGTKNETGSVGVLSLNIEGFSCATVSQQLEDRFGILTRSGLHCAPAAHRMIGTFPAGSVRCSLSRFTTTDDISHTVQAISELIATR